MAALGVVVAAVVATLALGAAPAAAETTITAQAGAEDWYWPGRSLPVTVTVSADRLISGTVRVTTGSSSRFGGPPSSATVDVPIEVSGGTTKEVVAVLPSVVSFNQPNGGSDYVATVELRQNDTVVAKTEAKATYAQWIEPVGVLPSFAALGELPDTAPLPLSAGTARFAPISPAVLEAGSRALEVFPSIVALPADLRELSPTARAALAEWLGQGGHLLVDGPAGAFEGLPDTWQPTGGWVRTGLGDVRTTGGAAQAGRWAEVLVVTPAGTTNLNSSGMGGGFFDSTILGALGRDAGFQLPQLGVLLGFLVAYVLLAGPITFIVLAKVKRRTLAWLVVPVLAALFTSIFAVGGARLRESVDTAHATVIDLAPGGARAYSTVLVGSINGGRTELRLPTGWGPDGTTSQLNNFSTGQSVASSVPAITADGSGSVATMNLDPGEFDLVRASGPVTGYDDALVVEATTDGSEINGTVVNNLDVALDEVLVLINGDAEKVGRVEARSRETFTISTPIDVEGGAFNGMNGMPWNGMPEMSKWPVAPSDMGSGGNGPMAMPAMCAGQGCMGGGQIADDGTAVNLSHWQMFASENSRRIRHSTTVTAVGWSKELSPPLTVDDDQHAVRRGRTAVMAHGAVRATGLDSVGLGMELLRDSDLREPEAREDEGERPPIDDLYNGPTFRFTLPTAPDGAPIDPTTIFVRAPVDLHRVAVLTATGWKTSPEVLERGIAFPLAPEDVIAGTVTVRVRAGDHFNQRPGTNSGLYSGWRFVEEAPATDIVPMTPVPAVAEPAAAPASGA